MQQETITFDKLPQAVTYLTEQVAELKQMVSASPTLYTGQTRVGRD